MVIVRYSNSSDQGLRLSGEPYPEINEMTMVQSMKATDLPAPTYQFIYIHTMHRHQKPLEWIGSSHKDLMALPVEVRRVFGFALSLAQAGDRHDAAKVLKGFGGAGVLEVVEDEVGGTYRAVYTVKFAVKELRQ